MMENYASVKNVLSWINFTNITLTKKHVTKNVFREILF